jgi:D-arabinose 1-dehydrogenase-like Zn-dependent alcohol dehydrogenase
MCGRVERLGAGVTTDSMGSRCAKAIASPTSTSSRAAAARSCLHDEMGACPRKARPNRVAGTAPYFNNAYGEYYYLRPNHYVFKIPDEISDDVATPANCALSQVLYGLSARGCAPGTRS